MYYIGIDLGGTNIAVGIVDESFKIVKKGSTPTLVNRDPELIIADMGKLCLELLAETGIGLEEVVCAGIAAPGSVNPRTGIIEYANNLPFLRFPIADTLRKYLPVRKVYLENDANAAALGEAVGGAAKGKRLSVMITLGTGVGGGVIIDGKIYSGFNYAGAELGHTVIEYNGRQCSCGRKGCWEAYSSATGLVNITKDYIVEARAAGKKTIMDDMIGGDLSKVSARTAFNAMKQGDEVGAAVVDEYISYLSCGIVNMINIFQPNVLSIGGGVCNEGDYLMKPLLEKVWGETYTREGTPRTQILIAKLGNDAGIIGAAVLGK